MMKKNENSKKTSRQPICLRRIAVGFFRRRGRDGLPHL